MVLEEKSEGRDSPERGGMNYVHDKVIIVTGAASGFGRMTAVKAGELGARVVCIDLNAQMLEEVVSGIVTAGGSAISSVADVRQIDDLRASVEAAKLKFGHVDVLVNNAGTMPLAFISDHEAALDAWNKCIDINFKGVMNGTIAVYDTMIKQGAGQIVNVSSIYGNHPVIGASIYGATKAAVNYFSNSVRHESRGKIKVSIIKPTGVPATGLSNSVVNPEGVVGILGQNALEFQQFVDRYMNGEAPPATLDPAEIGYAALDPSFIADAIIHVINQPLGVTLSEITVRATGDHYIL